MLTAVFADSLIAGPAESIPAVREALALLEVDSEILNLAMPWRLTRQQLPFVAEVVRSRRDLVIVSHGGSDGMKVRRPPRAGHTTDVLVESARTTWRRDTVHRARLGNRRPAVPFRSYARAYRRLVGVLLEQTDALVVQIGPGGGGRPSGRYADDSRPALLRELESAWPQRLVTVWPTEVLVRWEDFRHDRTHLTAAGQTKIAHQLASRLSGRLAPGKALPHAP